MTRITSERLHTCRESAVAARSRALSREFFGGIWYKIFSERGPSI